MENEEQNIGNQAAAGALSIYGQADAAMDDFPVLKAFQQYIDAEQSKSRKRMILLCMFFGALMTILVAIFVFMLAQMSRDKQHVNDQLIEFLMKERERAPATVPQTVVQPAANPAQDAALKAMTETLTTLQKQMADQRKADEEAAAASPTKAEIELERRAEQEAAKIRKAQERLEAEKRALKEEKERLHKEEVERQRRRLYPEYYQRQEQSAAKPIESPSRIPTPSPKPTPRKIQLSDQDIDDILREIDTIKSEDEEDEVQTKSKTRNTAKNKNKDKTKNKKSEKKKADKREKDDEDAETSVDKPIEYFTDTEYALPVKVNGEDASWSLPLN